jgi:hypothetical protein
VQHDAAKLVDVIRHMRPVAADVTNRIRAYAAMLPSG